MYSYTNIIISSILTIAGIRVLCFSFFYFTHWSYDMIKIMKTDLNCSWRCLIKNSFPTILDIWFHSLRWFIQNLKIAFWTHFCILFVENLKTKKNIKYVELYQSGFLENVIMTNSNAFLNTCSIIRSIGTFGKKINYYTCIILMFDTMNGIPNNIYIIINLKIIDSSF